MIKIKFFMALPLILMLHSCASLPLIISTTQTINMMNTVKDITNLPNKRLAIAGAFNDAISDMAVGSIIRSAISDDEKNDITYTIYKKTIVLGGTVRTIRQKNLIIETIKKKDMFDYVEDAIKVGEARSLLEYFKNETEKDKIIRKVSSKIKDNMALEYYNGNIYILGELTKYELDVVINKCVENTKITGIRYYVTDANSPDNIISDSNYRNFEFKQSKI